LLYLTIYCDIQAAGNVFIDFGKYRTNQNSTHITPWILKPHEIAYLC